MFLVFDDRPSDSPVVERVWHCHSERTGRFLSVASSHWEMVVTRHMGQMLLTIRGPETRVSTAECPAGAEWVGIRFKLGTFMPRQPVSSLIDRRDVTLSAATNRSFWLNGSAWDYPTFENAETFVKRLVKAKLVVQDIAVADALRGRIGPGSLRSTQRHFLHATGMTYSRFRQIERARRATNLLRQGASILDTVHEAGYFDQAHLTRSLKHLIGQTPGEVIRAQKQLSFLYKTSAVACA